MNACKRIFTILFTALLFFSWQVVSAQQPVKGKVVDSNQSALAGVSILVKGTTKGTVTDASGNYTISVGKSAVLIFQSLGFAAKEIEVGGRSTIDVVLESTSQNLDEVVVTALGIKREQKALGYSVGTISSKEITASGNTNFGSALYGKVAVCCNSAS